MGKNGNQGMWLSAFLVILVIALLGFFVLVLNMQSKGTVLPPSMNWSLPINIQTPQQQTPTPETPEPIVIKPDLREVALPWLSAFPDVQTTCITFGGDWVETHDAIGCQGAGTPNCNTAILIAARQQCLAVGADFVCNANDLYCAYG